MSNVQIRDILRDAIEKEIFGPHEKDETFSNSYHPKTRYLSGILYPIQSPVLEEDYKNDSVQIHSKDESNEDEKISLNVGTKPSSMGLSCNIAMNQKYVSVEISYGKYIQVEIINSNENTSVLDKKEINTSKIKKEKKEKKYPDWKRIDHCPKSFNIDLSKLYDKKELEPKIFFRYFIHQNFKEKTLTLNVFLTNENKIIKGDLIKDTKCIFQPKIKLSSPNSVKIFDNISKLDEKKIEKSNMVDRTSLFLFRNFKHFGQGRNCAIEWDVNESDDKTAWIQTTFIPQYIVPEIKPREPTREIKKSLDMKQLSCITNFKEYRNLLNPILTGYETWINDLENIKKDWKNNKSNNLYEKKFISEQADIPQTLIENCKDALKRIAEGIDKISSDPLIGESFRFTNEVMYQNISHTKWAKENKEKITKGQIISEDGPNFTSFEPKWRLFQLAFLLLNIESIANPNSLNRNTSDLLWFPTGGGKTEAYYGVIAFTLAYRRIRGKDAKHIEDELDRYGVSIIMRYTYRLLTLQQFQRAVTLFCACEYVRMKNHQNIKKYGNHSFLVGLWVGSGTTPNSFNEAKKTIMNKRSNPNISAEKTDPIQLLNCPWCGRELTAFNYEFGDSNNVSEKICPKRIRIRCDKKCFFGKPNDPDHVLPVVFIDEDVRNLCPSLLIATVDKFAQISWNWKYSTFFGNVSQYCKKHGYSPGNASSTNTNDKCTHSPTITSIDKKPVKILVDVKRRLSPPELIIQDELHLIAGPLGTLTGLYETAINILCMNQKTKAGPKIIASTATTKKSDIQIKNLFNSDSTKIFPPQGFEFGESYFAKVLPINDQHLGKLHVGICSTSVSGYDVGSRISACVLRKIRHILENKDKFYFNGKYHKFSNNELDSYYTLVGYYNTIKHLGAAVRMYEDTIPGYMGTIIETSELIFDKNNNAATNNNKILKKQELTGRINAAKIPSILQNIETKLGDSNVLDALLCTNMLSVGVDVERLNTMIVNGQPKSTSEYIQATGRIGRKDPGIVITNYTYIKPRDLSHFENFIYFHSTFHNSVEPGTLTPFSSRSRDRGLSGIFLALIRFNSKILSENPMNFDINNPDIKHIVDTITKQILDRVTQIDPQEYDGTKKDIENLIKKWTTAVKECSSWTPNNKGILKYSRNQFTRKSEPNTIYLMNSSRDVYNKHTFVVSESLRDAETEILLRYSKNYEDGKQW